MLESKIEAIVTKHAKANGWLAYKWTSPANRGVPDRLYFKAGQLVIIEFKAPGKKPTALQTHVHTLLKAQGFWVHVIDNIEEGKQLLC